MCAVPWHLAHVTSRSAPPTFEALSPPLAQRHGALGRVAPKQGAPESGAVADRRKSSRQEREEGAAPFEAEMRCQMVFWRLDASTPETLIGWGTNLVSVMHDGLGHAVSCNSSSNRIGGYVKAQCEHSKGAKDPAESEFNFQVPCDDIEFNKEEDEEEEENEKEN